VGPGLAHRRIKPLGQTTIEPSLSQFEDGTDVGVPGEVRAAICGDVKVLRSGRYVGERVGENTVSVGIPTEGEKTLHKRELKRLLPCLNRGGGNATHDLARGGDGRLNGATGEMNASQHE
jgi:hypothetical protein